MTAVNYGGQLRRSITTVNYDGQLLRPETTVPVSSVADDFGDHLLNHNQAMMQAPILSFGNASGFKVAPEVPVGLGGRAAADS